MTAAFISLVLAFTVCEVLHFRHERELLRRLMSKDNTEYVKNYETEKKPLPPSPAKEAMKRWKSGKKG